MATKSLLVIHQFFAHEMICKLNSNISHMSSIILRVVVRMVANIKKLEIRLELFIIAVGHYWKVKFHF